MLLWASYAFKSTSECCSGRKLGSFVLLEDARDSQYFAEGPLDDGNASQRISLHRAHYCGTGHIQPQALISALI